MKKTTTTLLLFLGISLAVAQTPCVSNLAGGFDCNNIDLQSRLTNLELGGTASTQGNDIWGWTDPLNGKEYAIMGLTSHTAFVDISDPVNPIYLGKLPTATVNSIWRDIKVYNNHAYIVSEATDHGMQVFDLTNLRSILTPPLTFTAKFTYTGFGRAHNIAINEDTGYAYGVGTKAIGGANNGGGPHIVNISDTNVAPIFVTEYNAQGYTHDAQIVVYNGPDTQHLGKEIFFGANANKVSVVDFTDKNNPVLISTFTYPLSSYVHQGWLTTNQKYFILGDETDEQGQGINTKTIIIDYTDLDNPVLKVNYFGPTGAIDHNGYVKGNEFYLANYRAGLRIKDISNINSSIMTEIAYFDTYPGSNSNAFNGAWSVYPYFASGNIVISDIERGLFVVKKNAALSTNSFENISFSVFPNPAKDKISITSDKLIEDVIIYNVLGEKVFSKNNLSTKEFTIQNVTFPSGMYMINVNGTTSQKLIIK